MVKGVRNTLFYKSYALKLEILQLVIEDKRHNYSHRNQGGNTEDFSLSRTVVVFDYKINANEMLSRGR
jgi:hypothetical protein